MKDEQLYRRWLDRRRQTDVGDRFADDVMRRVLESPSIRPATERHTLLLVLGRLAVCSAACVAGMTPFLYLAYLAELIR